MLLIAPPPTQLSLLIFSSHPHQDHCRPAEDECGPTGSLPDSEGHGRGSEDCWDVWQRRVLVRFPVDRRRRRTFGAKRLGNAARSNAKRCSNCIHHWLKPYLLYYQIPMFINDYNVIRNVRIRKTTRTYMDFFWLILTSISWWVPSPPFF